MNARAQLRWMLPLALAACIIAGTAIYWHRARSEASSADLVGYLPGANSMVVYIDVARLRQSGILAKLAGTKSAEDPDYRQFVEGTQFDYREDLDAIAAAFQDGRVYFALRGRFHWSNIAGYAASQGGSCHNHFCVTPGSQPNRRISFYPLTPDVLAMAVGPDDFGAYQVARPTGHGAAVAMPRDPVWAVIPAAALAGMDTLPAAAKAFVPALQSADKIVLSIGADSAQQLQLGVHVTCKDASGAAALVTQLDAITKALRDALAREHKQLDPADLAGVLVAGNFHRDERQVYGIWPISKTFVDAIAGSY